MTNIPSDVESDTVVRGAAAHAEGFIKLEMTRLMGLFAPRCEIE